MKKIFVMLICVMVAASAAQGAVAAPKIKIVTADADMANMDAKIIMVFYSPGCRECSEIMEKFLPEMKKKHNDKILIVDYNIDNMESYAFFLELQDKYDERAGKGFFNPEPPAVFVGNKLLYGVKEIKEKIEDVI